MVSGPSWVSNSTRSMSPCSLRTSLRCCLAASLIRYLLRCQACPFCATILMVFMVGVLSYAGFGLRDSNLHPGACDPATAASGSGPSSPLGCCACCVLSSQSPQVPGGLCGCQGVLFSYCDHSIAPIARVVNRFGDEFRQLMHLLTYRACNVDCLGCPDSPAIRGQYPIEPFAGCLGILRLRYILSFMAFSRCGRMAIK